MKLEKLENRYTSTEDIEEKCRKPARRLGEEYQKIQLVSFYKHQNSPIVERII